MANYKKKSVSQNTNNPSLSSQSIQQKKGMSDADVQELNKKVYAAINNLELQKSLDKFLKENKTQHQTAMRDLNLLKSIITEYLDSFILFGYSIDGERVIIQNFEKSKDRDALMEFLKIIFFKQQQDNFLDE
jgi:tRNA G37 N-methylase Trm5